MSQLSPALRRQLERVLRTAVLRKSARKARVKRAKSEFLNKAKSTVQTGKVDVNLDLLKILKDREQAALLGAIIGGGLGIGRLALRPSKTIDDYIRAIILGPLLGAGTGWAGSTLFFDREALTSQLKSLKPDMRALVDSWALDPNRAAVLGALVGLGLGTGHLMLDKSPQSSDRLSALLLAPMLGAGIGFGGAHALRSNTGRDLRSVFLDDKTTVPSGSVQ